MSPDLQQGAQIPSIPENMIPREQLNPDEISARRLQQASVYERRFPNWTKMTETEKKAVHVANLILQAPTKRTMSALNWAQLHDYDALDADGNVIRRMNGNGNSAGV